MHLPSEIDYYLESISVVVRDPPITVCLGSGVSSDVMSWTPEVTLTTNTITFITFSDTFLDDKRHRFGRQAAYTRAIASKRSQGI